MPGLSSPPMPIRLSPQWAIRALTSVPSGLPAAGCTTSPARLSVTVRSLSLSTMSGGILWPCGVWVGGGGLPPQPGRLFDNDEVLVLIADVERDVLALRCRSRGRRHGDLIF